MANLTQKQIAQRLGVSQRTIRRNEARLGLAAIRVEVNKRLVLYPASKVNRVLRSRGLDPR